MVIKEARKTASQENNAGEGKKGAKMVRRHRRNVKKTTSKKYENDNIKKYENDNMKKYEIENMNKYENDI